MINVSKKKKVNCYLIFASCYIFSHPSAKFELSDGVLTLTLPYGLSRQNLEDQLSEVYNEVKIDYVQYLTADKRNKAEEIRKRYVARKLSFGESSSQPPEVGAEMELDSQEYKLEELVNTGNISQEEPNTEGAKRGKLYIDSPVEKTGKRD